MKETLNLEHAIKINGKSVKEVTYDADEITAGLFAEADVKKKQAAGIKNLSISPAVEFDFGLHLFLGFAAILAVNPEYSFEVLEAIHGKDLTSVMKVGRDFLLSSEEDSSPNSLEEQSETTVKPTAQA